MIASGIAGQGKHQWNVLVAELERVALVSVIAMLAWLAAQLGLFESF